MSNLNAGIILASQHPNTLRAMGEGIGQGNAMAEIQRQAQMRNLLREQGPGIMQGDQNALAKLAQLSPEAALGIQGQRQDLAAGELSMDATRQRMRILDAQEQRAVAEAARQMSAQERAAQAAEIERGISMGMAAQTPEQWDRTMQSLGRTELVGRFGDRQVLAAQFMDMADILKMNEGPQYRQITGEDAAAMGLDPAKAYNVGRDGKVTSIGGGGVTVNAPQVGSIPQGYELFQDQATGAYQMRPIKGGPEDTSKEDARAQQIKRQQADIVLDEIGLAKEIIAGESALSPATGITGGIASQIDSTRAGRLKNRLETIKANIGFDKLQSMRDASPTGGALGQVSEFENRLLQAVFGSLVQSQDAETLVYNLDRLEAIYNRIIHEGIPENEARAMYGEIVGGQPATSQPAQSQDRVPDFTQMSDEELDRWIEENSQ